MRRPFYIIENALPGNMLGEVMRRGLAIPAKPATVGFESSQRTDPVHRVTSIRWLDKWQNADLRQHVWQLFDDANRNAFGVDIGFGPQEFQFSEYRADQKGHYDWHEDTHWDTGATYDRKLSMSIQLSDPSDYEGGQFEFDSKYPSLAKDFERFKKRGSALIFPSFMRHRVTPVTSGVRMALVTWCDGPRWR